MTDTYDQTAMIGELVIEEGLRTKIYVDTVGKRSIGIGRNLDDVGISTAEAYALCANDLAAAEAALDHGATWWRSLSPVRQRVVLDMTFNLGWSKFSAFHQTLQQIAAGQFAAASVSMLDSLWAKQVGARATRLSTMMRTNLPPSGIPSISQKVT